MNNTINNSVPKINFKQVVSTANTCPIQKNCENNKNCTDLTNVYTQENIVDILKEAGTYNKTVYPCKYSITYYPNSESLIINNTNMTNDTTVIEKSGKVRHCGSWHNEEITHGEKFTAIVNDAIERIEVMNK